MKKNYIKPVSKTVLAELAVGAMEVIASVQGIDYGGEDQGEHDPEAPEIPEDLIDEHKQNSYSLW